MIVSLFVPWYENAFGKLSAWDTFGPGVVLLIAAAAAALALVVSTLTERSTALPVAAGVWSTLFGIIAVIAAIVRLIERPQAATDVRAGAWLALAGAILILRRLLAVDARRTSLAVRAGGTAAARTEF